MTINHAIKVNLPTEVLFKAGEDWAILKEVKENGRRLIFDGGPQWSVKVGESIHIRDDSLVVSGEFFSVAELEKIDKVRKFGFDKYFLSYVQNQRYVDQFVELVGKDAEIRLKIEDPKGLDYVARDFRKTENIILVAARGDMFVEVKKPHDILAGLKLIIEKDPEASAGSRILLSTVQSSYAEIRRFLQGIMYKKSAKKEITEFIEYLGQPQVPSCADFCDLAWLYDIGYRDMMLCDEICLKDNLLSAAVNAFDAFRSSYAKPKIGEVRTPVVVPAQFAHQYNPKGWGLTEKIVRFFT
jgi:pyruvate kinase